MADKAFITPTAFGQYLHDLYAQTAEEVQHSKAKLVESIKKELAAVYAQQLQAHAEQLHQAEGSKKDLAAAYERQLQAQAEQLQQANLLLEQAKGMVAEKAKPNVAMIILVLVLGAVAGAVAVYFWRR